MNPSREAAFFAVRLKEALQRLVELYEETEHPECAADCKTNLAELEKAEKAGIK
jgi:hypothetical protein